MNTSKVFIAASYLGTPDVEGALLALVIIDSFGESVIPSFKVLLGPAQKVGNISEIEIWR